MLSYPTSSSSELSCDKVTVMSSPEAKIACSVNKTITIIMFDLLTVLFQIIEPMELKQHYYSYIIIRTTGCFRFGLRPHTRTPFHSYAEHYHKNVKLAYEGRGASSYNPLFCGPSLRSFTFFGFQPKK